VGTEIDAPLGFDKKAVEFISEYLGYEFMSAQNKFAYQSTPTDLIEVMGVLLRASDTLAKIASDIRMSAAGPNNFINELELPVTQKGSSIMPGKINPVEIEQIMSLHSLVVGYNATVVQVCGQSFFQLTTAYPILIYVFYAAIDMLSTFYSKFADYLLDISVNIEKCKENVLNNPILLTRLKTTHGYSKATEVVNYSKEKKVSFFQAAMDVLGISRTEAEELLDPLAMTKPEIN
ncbi:MAG: lyase family protein, partial [Desulfatiglandales bacterium]